MATPQPNPRTSGNTWYVRYGRMLRAAGSPSTGGFTQRNFVDEEAARNFAGLQFKLHSKTISAGTLEDIEPAKKIENYQIEKWCDVGTH